MKNILTLVITFLLFNSIYGQYMTKGTIEELQKKKLLVITDPDEKSMEKLAKDPEALKVFLADNETEHAYLKEAMLKYWTINKDISFVSRDQAKEKMKENKDAYAVMSLVRVRQEYTHNFTGFSDYYYYTSIVIAFPTINKNKVFGNLPSGEVSKASYYAGIRFLENYMQTWLDGSIYQLGSHDNLMKIKEGKLLLNSAFCDKKTNQDIVNELYPYNAVLVEKEEIDKAILEEQDVFYIFKSPVMGMKENVKLHYFVNAKTGKIYAGKDSGEGLDLNAKVLKLYNTIVNKK
ncbi:MAG: hypothetical protein JXR60_08845 [Bacteroidales bacterium]|nr:hypothetical protein [Bacteroidales bacterium]